jgi:hypothetical protein
MVYISMQIKGGRFITHYLKAFAYSLVYLTVTVKVTLHSGDVA